ncbi:MAG: adenylate kinase, partial [Gaiellaceae bacterium]
MNVLLLGPQGSGKGTQARLIAEAYEIPHVGTGDMLREAIASGEELGRRVQPIVDAGQLVPDHLMVELIRERLSRDDAREGFVLDGFPRTLAQAEALDGVLRELGRELDIVLELQVPEAVSVQRLLERARLEGRSDDTPEGIRTRLSLYRDNTQPLVEYYRARSKLVGIHGDREVQQVFSEIQQAIERAEAPSRRLDGGSQRAEGGGGGG